MFILREINIKVIILCVCMYHILFCSFILLTFLLKYSFFNEMVVINDGFTLKQMTLLVKIINWQLDDKGLPLPFSKIL